jgi:hypothetical protein
MTRARDVATQGGLVLLNTTAFNAQSAISIDNVYTSSYANYFTTISYITAGTGDIAFKLRASGTTTSANYNFQALEVNNTSVSSSRSNSQSSAAIGNWSNGDFRCSISFNVFNPQIATSTTYQTNSYASLGGFNSAFLKLFAGNQSSTTQFDGFEVSTLSGTMTGTIKVYGYK